MSKKEILENIEVYCQQNTCGDKIHAVNGSIVETKRKMNFSGFNWRQSTAIYICPVCNSKRKFKHRFFGSGYKEV